MKAVILDGFTLNPGDLSWDNLTQLADFTIYDRTESALVRERSENADILFTNKVILDAAVIESLPDLKFIGLFSTGVNVVDLKAASQRGIPVANIPAYSTESVAQLTIAHLLNFAFKLGESINSVATGGWVRSIDFSYWPGTLIELEGKTIGIVGFGSIGRRVAELANAFKMKVLAYGPRLTPGTPIHGATAVDLPTLLAESDFVSLHCPLTESNRSVINATTLAQMKPTACLINTARGLLIDETALADALNRGIIAGAALDVLCKEPPDADCPLLTAKNCAVTPHFAWGTLEARRRLMAIAGENLQAFLAGSPQNVVNG